MTTIGILGGTGPAGRGVAARLANAGCDVVLGSRDSRRANEVAGNLLPRGPGTVSGATNEDAALSTIIIVATPWDSAVATVRSLKSQLVGKTVISKVNALAREGRELVPLYPARGSIAAQITFALPESRVVGAFHHLPAATMEDQDSDLDADVVIFSDHEEDRRLVAEFVNRIEGLRAVIAGSMSLASSIEAFTAVCKSINIRYKSHSYVKLRG
ncbi:MAG: NADPH-dependent F420 reductase [Acidimicrobiaceae bacterium]|nr:NADPH-dependent F420 reductase [Acidimicrobiaceae bacterium]